MMKAAAFATNAGATILRASAAPNVSVERLSERTATLTWPLASRSTSPFTILYGAKGTKLQSRRTVSRPMVDLRNLRPGVTYEAEIKGAPSSSFYQRVSFTTTMTSSSSSSSFSSSSTAEGVEEEAPLTELSRLEIRVGKIIACEKHPNADSLYVEQVDVGEPEPRTIVSGLVNFVPLEEMLNRNVIVLCNLKPRAMRGVTSHGMLLCASNEDKTKVDPLAPPIDAPLGELITFIGHKAAPIDPGNRASKAFDRVADSFRCDENGVAKYEDAEFSTSVGPCVSPKGLVGSVS